MQRYELTATFDGPVISRGLAASSWGLDAAMRRDAAGRPCLPGAHLRGRVREAIESMCATAGLPADRVAGRLFGLPQDRGRPARRGVLVFGDLVADEDAPPAETASLAVDARTGAARSHHLRFVEADRVGRRRTFRGAVWVPDRLGPHPARTIAALLEAALHWLDGLGAGVAGGWGEVQAWTVSPAPDRRADLLALLEALAGPDPAEEPVDVPPTVPERPAAAAVVGVPIRLRLRSPLVVGNSRLTPNLLEARWEIPGSVIRRALADALLEAAGLPRGGWVGPSLAARLRRLAHESEEGGSELAALARLAAAFGRVHASFARPLPRHGPASPEPVPPRTRLRGGRDILLPLLEAGDGPPPAFPLDELDAEPPAAPNWLPRELYTHVAMNRRSGAARTGQLYSVQAVRPLHDPDEQGERTAVTFAATLHCPPERADDLARALPRVRWIGKLVGRGYGQVEVEVSEPPPPDDWRDRVGRWWERCAAVAPPGRRIVPLTLQTEALLLDADALQVGTPLEEACTEALREALEAAGGGAPRIEVVLALAHHRLRGGVTAQGEGALPPALLTLPGATFAVRWPGCDDQAVLAALAHWARHGLQRPSLIEGLARRWRRPVPFLSDNGYGAVHICDACHLSPWAPPEEAPHA